MSPKTGRYLIAAPTLGAGLVFANLIFGLMLAPAECGGDQLWLRGISLAMTLVVVLAAGVTYWNVHCIHRTERFVLAAGTLTSFVLAYTLALQTLSAAVLDPCLR